LIRIEVCERAEPTSLAAADTASLSQFSAPFLKEVVSGMEVPADDRRIASKTVVELDLVGYSAICENLEQGLGPNAVAQLNRQIQSFIDVGLLTVGAIREEVVLKTTGDGAILQFDSAEVAHRFVEAEHAATAEHNRTRQPPLSKRVFRCGAATGDVDVQLLQGGGFELAGTSIARAVRLEGMSQPGGLLVDEATCRQLSSEQRGRYGPMLRVAGKRDEEFDAYACQLNADGPADAAYFNQLLAKPRSRRKLPRREFLWLGAAAGAVSLGAVAWALRSPRIRIAIKPFVGYCPLVVAQTLELCQNLNIEFKTVKTVLEMKDAVQSGEVDAAMWLACTHGLFCSAGVRAQAVMKLDESKDGDGVVVSKSIKSLSDLRGKRIAIQKWDAGEYMFRSLCNEYNVEYDSLIGADDHTEPNKAAAEFIEGNVDAASTYEPYLSMIDTEVKTKPRWTAKNLNFGIVDLLVVSTDYLQENSGPVRRLIEGCYRGLHEIRNKSPQAVKSSVQFLQQADPTYNEDQLYKDIADNVVELADLKANVKFFERVRGTSEFQRHYENGVAVFRSVVIKKVPFTQTDGSQQFLDIL